MVIPFYWPECKSCGRILIETCAPISLVMGCPDCRGVNIFRNSTEAVEYLSPSDLLDVAQLDRRTNSEKEKLALRFQQDQLAHC